MFRAKHTGSVLKSDRRDRRRRKTAKRRNRFDVSNKTCSTRRIQTCNRKYDWPHLLNSLLINSTTDDNLSRSFNSRIAATPLASALKHAPTLSRVTRSEERRVGKEWSSRRCM